MFYVWLIFKIYLILAGVGFPVLLFVNFFGNPIPFPFPPSPWGHAHYGVTDETFLKLLKKVVTETTGQRFRFTWADGPQMIAGFLFDSMTAFCCIDKTSQGRGLRGTGRSFPVRNPKRAAEEAAFMIHHAGYEVQVIEDYMPHRKEKIYIVTCPELLGWELIYRLPDTKMGALPKIISFWR